MDQPVLFLCELWLIDFVFTSPVLPTTMGLSGPSSGIEDLVAPLAGGIIAAIAMIVIVLVVIVICLFMTNIKRKKIVKEIQMEVLTK